MVVAPAAAVGSRETSRQRLCVVFCCGPDRRLGNQAFIPDQHCAVVRLTENEDMTTKEGKAFAAAKLEEFNKEMKSRGQASDKRITFGISIPCTGGSPWQYVSEAVYYCSGNEKALNN
eukprot:1988277-Pyramimonas_sp.AAC.1